MTLATVCALAATLLNAPRRAVPALDTARLLATLRDPELKRMLEPYGNRNNRIGKEVLNAPAVCKYKEGRHVLVLNVIATDDNSFSSAGSTATLLFGEDYELDQIHSTPLLQE
ncbi:hypothetical protein CVT26_000245 [Gymnopilus dilepis]|uniref:Uncharacterized protein n=1 Tax=Gymnopilus dilepis TaxID=231916 RepID=A0A409VGA3_9AGAR|nr:hypothetical protein CVT26_000245 [Gymnopilus dilepis]